MFFYLPVYYMGSLRPLACFCNSIPCILRVSANKCNAKRWEGNRVLDCGNVGVWSMRVYCKWCYFHEIQCP